MKRIFLIKTIILSVIIYFLLFFMNYFIDVFGIHTKNKYFVNDSNYARYQNIGIAKNGNYNAYIIGTSLSENISVSLVNKLHFVNAVKIPFSGASAHEQYIMAHSSINSKTKLVIWDIHYTAFNGDPLRMHISQEFPYYLYDDDFINDFTLYSNFNITLLSIKKILFNFGFFKNYFTDNFDLLYNNSLDRSKFGKEKVLSCINRMKNNSSFVSNFKKNNNFSTLKNSFEYNIISIIKKNPSVKFIFYIPPYQPFYFYWFYKFNMIDDIIKFKKFIIISLLKYKNVELYDFSIDYETIKKLKHYKDTHHFDQEISNKIQFDIANKKFLVQDNNNTFTLNIKKYKKYIVTHLKGKENDTLE